MSQQNRLQRSGLPAELMNELFASIPWENAFGLLAKMPNSLLARNVQKMINGIKEAMKNNKWNEEDGGPKLTISEEGLGINYSGPFGVNRVHAILPIPIFNLNLRAIKKPIIVSYFEVQILNKTDWMHRFSQTETDSEQATLFIRNYGGINIGFFGQHFQLEKISLQHRIDQIRGIWINNIWTSFKNFSWEFMKKGDFVGIGLIRQLNAKMECFATLNGKLLGKAVLPTMFTDFPPFPAVTLADAGASVLVNFGKDKWCFKNFDAVLKQRI